MLHLYGTADDRRPPGARAEGARGMDCNYDALIVGGGFYGCEMAVRLRQRLPRVLLVEGDAQLLGRASYHNQARIHNGYHYPRSLLTALRSRLSYARFKTDYADCVADQFEKYYAIP